MTKYRISVIMMVLGILFVYNNASFGFGNKMTHPAITNTAIQSSAVDAYIKGQLAINNGIQTQLEYQSESYETFIEYRLFRGGYSAGGNNRTILEWMEAGSVIEDEDLDTWPPFLPSIRPRHHFHNPLSNEGLDNKTDHPNYSWFINIPFFDVTGQSAMSWAVNGDAQQKPYDNFECWESARYDFHRALSEPNKSQREEFLANVFLGLGSVLHLIEDMGVPAHTRNDFLFGHLTYDAPATFGNDFENWVERITEQNGGQLPWSGSGPVAFDKLTKYFDANAYTGSYLGDGVTPPDTWGLSECSNYQFLSLSTMFKNIELQSFPHATKARAAVITESNRKET